MRKIALLGNPNSGKTSLFNTITGLNQHVGNFSGVTVDRKSSKITLPNGEKALIVDLPGAHSLSPNSLDEQVVHDILLNKEDKDHPNELIIVLDASTLNRGLFLTTQAIDLGMPVIVALNMTDVADNQGVVVDRDQLAQCLGVPVFGINARKNAGVVELMNAVANGQAKRGVRVFDQGNYADFLSNVPDQKAQLDEVGARHKKIVEWVVASTSKSESPGSRLTSRLDKILLHRVLGPIIFLAIFMLMFQAIFAWASYPMDGIDWLFGTLNDALSGNLGGGMWESFVLDGVLAGINGVVIFLPQILILFGFIAVLEETGYMARASFLNDKLLGFTGMNGKSIVPLVGGLACAVPAIMAARSIGSPRARLITILVTPLMSCSARLPVYIFLVAFIVPDQAIRGVFNMQGLFMLGLYVLGIVATVAVAWFLSRMIKSKGNEHFVLQLPDYQPPRWKNVGITMWQKGWTFVKEAGKIIIIVSMILWVLASFGPGDSFEEIEQKYATTELAEDEKELLIASEQLEASYAGIMGKAIEPAIRPLGFDWKIGIALVTSFAAREVFVGTMTTIYSLEGDVDNVEDMREKMAEQVDPKTGEPVMNLPTALSLVMFYVFAMQCMSTVAVVKTETGGWKWPIIQFIYLTGMAYVASLIVYQVLT